jgi:hypothetical protein
MEEALRFALKLEEESKHVKMIRYKMAQFNLKP